MKRILSILFLLIAVNVSALQYIPESIGGYMDSSGDILENGYVAFYSTSGLSSFKDVYSDYNGTTTVSQSGNGIALNASGQPTSGGNATALFGDGTYWIRLKDSDGITVATYESINYSEPASGSDTPWVNIANVYGTENSDFQEALAAYTDTATEVTFLMNGDFTISSSQTVLSHIRLWFVNGSSMTVESGNTLAIESNDLVFENKSYISNAGTVDFNGTKIVDNNNTDIFQGSGTYSGHFENDKLSTTWFTSFANTISFLNNSLDKKFNLLILDTITLAANTTIPTNAITIDFTPNGIITGNYTLTASGQHINAPPVRIWGDDLTVTGYFNNTEVVPQWWGVISNDILGDSVAFQKAMTFVYQSQLAGVTVPGTDIRNTLYLPTGVYLLHEIVVPGFVGIRSDNSRSAILVYDGDGGADSYIYKCESGISFGQLKNVTFRGYNYLSGLTTDAIADKLFWVEGYADMMFQFENVQFQSCFGNAVQFDAIINLTIEQARWDAIGGHCLEYVGGVGSERRPITISEITIDNNIGGSLEAAAIAQGYYVDSDTGWSKPPFYANDGRGTLLSITGFRFEGNEKMNTTKPCLIYSDASAEAAEFSLKDVRGYFHSGDNYPPILYSENTKYDLMLTNASLDNSREAVFVASTPSSIPYRQRAPYLVARSNDQQQNGISINGTKIMRINNLGANFSLVRTGDTNFKVNYYPPNNSLSSVVTYPPQDGIASAGAIIPLSTSANIASGNKTLNLGGTFEIPPIKSYVIVSGAGVAGADLYTYVTSVNRTNNTVVLNASANTTVSGVTANYDIAIWKQTGQVVARNKWDDAGTHPEDDTGFYYSSRGDVSISQTGSTRHPDAWICTSDGSRTTTGNWKPFGVYSGTTAQRPTIFKTEDRGYPYYDTDLDKMIYWGGSAWIDGSFSLSGAVAWDPASIANGATETKSVTVTGASIGDYSTGSLNISQGGLTLSTYVSAGNTVTAVLSNNTGGAVDLASTTVNVVVMPK